MIFKAGILLLENLERERNVTSLSQLWLLIPRRSQVQLILLKSSSFRNMSWSPQRSDFRTVMNVLQRFFATVYKFNKI